MNSRQLAVLLALGGIWGASFLFIKVIIDDGIEPIGLSGSRSLLGTLTLLPIVWRVRSQFPRDARTWLFLAVLGFVNFALPWTLFGVAAQHAPSGAASIANSSQPLWAAIFATILLKADGLSGWRLAGLILGFVGVLCLMGEDLLQASGSGALAILIMVGATLCYGMSAVAIRRFLSHVPAIPLTVAQLGFSSLFLVPLAAATGALPSTDISAAALGSLLMLGGLGSGVTVAGYMWLIHQVGPVRAAVVTYLMPPIGVTLGWLVLDEPVGWNLLLGLACVIAGVAMVQGVRFGTILRRAPLSAVTSPAGASD